jgi:hypothetical protein
MAVAKINPADGDGRSQPDLADRGQVGQSIVRHVEWASCIASVLAVA